MRILYYTFLNLLHNRNSNLLKIFSLALGLTISILLLSRVAFELSMNRDYGEPDRLYILSGVYTDSNDPSDMLVEPLTRTIGELFPEYIESVTTTKDMWGVSYYNDTHRLGRSQTFFADPAFFRTMGIEVLSGEVDELQGLDNAFISQELCARFFGDKNPVGEVLMYNNNFPVVVRGVFADIPENSTWRPEVVVSLPTLFSRFDFRSSWNGGDAYLGFIRFKDKEGAKRVESRLPEIVSNYMPEFKEDFGYELVLTPVTKKYTSNPDIKRMIWIMGTLAVAILIIVAMNYVLLAVASMASRSKGIGVHKANGATSREIFNMFLWETGIVIFISLLVVLLVMVNFSDYIEDLVSAKLVSLFNIRTLWAPVVIVVVLFLFAAVIPARMFATLPVTQIFRRYTNKKNGWKRPLLFVQFTGVAFIFGLLLVITTQYRSVMNRDLGYDPVNLVYCQVRTDGAMSMENLKEEIKRLPFVKEVGVSWNPIYSGHSGMGVNLNGKYFFSPRFWGGDFDFLKAAGLDLVEGKNFDADGQVIVNEAFVRRFNWTDGAVGKVVESTDLKESGKATIVGVIRDIETSAYWEIEPVVILAERSIKNGTLYIRLYDRSTETVRRLNEVISSFYPQQEVSVISQEEANARIYVAVRRFRDGVVLAAVAILLITITGLMGYVNDEIRRRSKEIAIRKVNGGETADILRLLSTEVLRTAVPAVFVGMALSWIIGKQWLQQFQVQTSPELFSYLGATLFILVLIILIVLVKAYRIAVDNPVNSIKSE